MGEFSYRADDGVLLHATAVGTGPAVVLLHGGGPDHRSLLPLARLLADRNAVVVPDVRGYGRSVCADPARHTWARYADDVVDLLDHIGVDRAVVGGTGLGATVAMRTAAAHADRVAGTVLISVEDIEDDEAKRAETAFMDAFAERVRTEGIEARPGSRSCPRSHRSSASWSGTPYRARTQRASRPPRRSDATGRSAPWRRSPRSPRRRWSSPGSTSATRPRSRQGWSRSCPGRGWCRRRSPPASARPTTSPRRSRPPSRSSWPTCTGDPHRGLSSRGRAAPTPRGRPRRPPKRRCSAATTARS
ncbi:alpha/beta hydrolase [Saccharopolyspora erythraea]|nr:alpha/beta hydrolase [Saccharopolyspora erythraea]